jgi:hypothetical protein
MNNSLPYRPLPPIQTVFKSSVIPASQRSNLLTPVQIENWRKILLKVIGPFALIMSDDDIQIYKDKCQQQTDINLGTLPKY